MDELGDVKQTVSVDDILSVDEDESSTSKDESSVKLPLPRPRRGRPSVKTKGGFRQGNLNHISN